MRGGGGVRADCRGMAETQRIKKQRCLLSAAAFPYNREIIFVVRAVFSLRARAER